MSTELKYCIASLRHLYANMMHNVVDSAQAKRIATGLLGPTIERLEKLSAPESAPDRLYAAVRTVCGQAGEAPEQFIEWLSNGGFAEMALCYFTRDRPASPLSRGALEKPE